MASEPARVSGPAALAPLPASVPPLPAGFVWAARDGEALVAADADLLGALGERGLLARAGLRAALSGAGGVRGRAHTAVVTLAATGPPGGAPPPALLLRPLRRGGALAPLLGGALLGPSRPFRELAVTAALRAAGAPVPRPALAAAWRHRSVWNAALATRLESGAVDAAAFLAAGPARTPVLEALRAAGRAVRRFHDAGGSHPDLHVANLLIRAGAGGCEALVIDLDGARAAAGLEPPARMVELMRLYRSLRKRGLLACVGERGCVAFFRAYVDGDRALRAGLLARLASERRRVAFHALHYRRGDAPR
jgi:hypothetical protein